VTYIRKRIAAASVDRMYLSIGGSSPPAALSCVRESLRSQAKKPPKSRILILIGLFSRPPIVEISALGRRRKLSVFSCLQLARQLPFSFAECDFDKEIRC
jgi:hypothetical protein